jgi:hypothetical protein
MERENLQKVVKKQAKITSEQDEIIRRLESLAREQQETIARPQKDSRNSSKPPSSDIRLVQQPGWLSNKPCKMLCILPFLSGSCSETEVSEQLYVCPAWEVTWR